MTVSQNKCRKHCNRSVKKQYSLGPSQAGLQIQNKSKFYNHLVISLFNKQDTAMN